MPFSASSGCREGGRSVAPSYPGAVQLDAMEELLVGGRDVLGAATRGVSSAGNPGSDTCAIFPFFVRCVAAIRSVVWLEPC